MRTVPIALYGAATGAVAALIAAFAVTLCVQRRRASRARERARLAAEAERRRRKRRRVGLRSAEIDAAAPEQLVVERRPAVELAAGTADPDTNSKDARAVGDGGTWSRYRDSRGGRGSGNQRRETPQLRLLLGPHESAQSSHESDDGDNSADQSQSAGQSPTNLAAPPRVAAVPDDASEKAHIRGLEDTAPKGPAPAGQTLPDNGMDHADGGTCDGAEEGVALFNVKRGPTPDGALPSSGRFSADVVAPASDVVASVAVPDSLDYDTNLKVNSATQVAPEVPENDSGIPGAAAESAETTLPSTVIPVKSADSPEPTYLADGEDTCVVCLDDLDVGNRVRRLPCNHVFHAECIRTWLRRKNACPCCCVHVVKRSKKRKKPFSDISLPGSEPIVTTSETVGTTAASIAGSAPRQSFDNTHGQCPGPVGSTSSRRRPSRTVNASGDAACDTRDLELGNGLCVSEAADVANSGTSFHGPGSRGSTSNDVVIDIAALGQRGMDRQLDRPRSYSSRISIVVAPASVAFPRNGSLLDPDDPNSEFLNSEASSHFDEPMDLVMQEVRRVLRGEVSQMSIDGDSTDWEGPDQNSVPDLAGDDPGSFSSEYLPHSMPDSEASATHRAARSNYHLPRRQPMS
jgi:Ring finger domain